MSDGLIKILDGNTFVVSDRAATSRPRSTDPTGLFSFDTRFLSKWVLTVNGERLNPLSIDDLQYFESRFFLVPGTGTVYVDSKLSVIRQRAVGDGFHEELTILNHDEKPVDLTVRIDAGCDFADLFEVKDALAKKGSYSTAVEKGRLVLGYERDKSSARDGDLGYRARAARRGRPHLHGQDRAPRAVDDRPGRRHGDAGLRRAARAPEVRAGRGRRNMQRNLERWLDDAPTARVRLGSAQGDLQPQPRRPRRAAVLAARAPAGEACPRPACPGS